MKIGQKKIFGLVLLVGGLALCGVGLWLLLSPAQFLATVRVKMENDAPESASNASYDPYFIQTSFEIIQSQLVLSNVVVNLNLNESWGKKRSDGLPLKTTESIHAIQNHLRLAPVRNTRLIAISFYSDDPKEAADVANAIAKAYCDYRINTRIEMTRKGIEVLELLYQDQKKQLSLQPTNNQLLENHKLLGKKIEEEKLGMQIPKHPMVQIVDRAEPPQTPVGLNRSLGVALLTVGLLSAFGGILLLENFRQSAG